MTVDVTPIAVRCATQNGSSGSSDVQDEDPQRDHQGGQYAVRRTQNAERRTMTQSTATTAATRLPTWDFPPEESATLVLDSALVTM
jgi:hypothetical protein